MHIYEGILTATPAGQGVLLAGTVAAAAGTMIGLRRLDEEQIPKAAVLGSAFFVVSAIQVPMFGSSVHLVLSGLMGLVLGWAVFPTVLVGLILQFAFFSIAGPTVLGINTLIMALPGVICHYLLRSAARSHDRWEIFASGFLAGSWAILLGALLSSVALTLAGNSFVLLAGVFLTAHIPIAGIEGLVTGSVVVLLRQVRPEILHAPPLTPLAQEVGNEWMV
jgi:cobalt/nickel transport system permease protein